MGFAMARLLEQIKRISVSLRQHGRINAHLLLDEEVEQAAYRSFTEFPKRHTHRNRRAIEKNRTAPRQNQRS